MKIGVVGCGNVGGACAYACALRGIGSELVLVDKNSGLAEAQAADILHATPFSAPLVVRAGTFDDLKAAGIVMIAAGWTHKPGETRLDLVEQNAAVFSQIIPQIQAAAPDAIILIATNPVDVLTYLTSKLSPAKPRKVIGSGTILDTARFRALLGQHLGVAPNSVHANVLGEHGESEVLHWSGVTIGNTPLEDFAAQVMSPVTHNIQERMNNEVRKAAAYIIKGKGATWFGIGAAMARIAQAIINDERAVITCSTLLSDIEGISDVALSLPHVIGASGVMQTIYPVLNENEQKHLRRSAETLKAAQQRLGAWL